MYRCVSAGELFPLLGDAKIRSDRDLMMNFGLASGSGVSDQKVVDELDGLRKALGTQYSKTAVAGSGSILNDNKWSPLLNDSFIMGGVHHRMEFHLALEGAESFMEAARQSDLADALKRLPATAAAQKDVVDALKRIPVSGQTYKEAWKRYLKATPDVLWNAAYQVPRVFARELMGLKTFGYVPVFNFGGLGFYGTSSGTSADFVQYLTALDNAGFSKVVREKIVAAVAEFLFGDAKALA
jgi:hypothetical protein